VEVGLLTEPRYTFKIHTYGCKVNTYDSGLLESRMNKSGYTASDKPQVHILNTCAVTAEATREAIKQIRYIKAREPFSTVVVTGCAAQVDTKKVSVPGADLVIANSHKGQLEDILDSYFKGTLDQRVFHSNIFKKEDLEAGGGVEAGHSRAFLKIQDGCNSFCTYCVIPFARGKSRSIPISQLVVRVNELYSQGVREVVLTGVHIADYASHKTNEDILAAARGKKLPETYDYLEDLVERLLAETKMPRFRLSSLEPKEVSPRLIDLYQNPRLCPHFHMSIQSANTKILAAMKRKYTAEDVEASLTMIADKIPNVFVGMDVIVGFPGETDEDFEDTFERLARLDWSRIHVFPYSERPGTVAESYTEKVAQHKISERAKRLRELSSQRYSMKAVAQVGAIKEGLVLQSSKRPQAVSRDYWTIHIKSAEGLSREQEYKIKILGYDTSMVSRMDGVLLGEILG
jgi:threonylcarbamoyladenosine tRNA methylthiotransferase MtaB